MRTIVFIGLLSLIFGCKKPKDFNEKFSFTNLKGKETQLKTDKEQRGYVFVFLLPDCPFSQFYTMSVNQIQSTYESKGYHFFGIVPGNLYSLSEIDSFKSKHNFNPELLVDLDSEFTKYLKVSVVPTVVLTDNFGNILYHGKIDDQAILPGQKKYKASKLFLLEALNSHSNNKNIQIKQTKAVGCFIE